MRRRDVASGPAPTWTDRERGARRPTGRAGGLGLLLATAVAGLSFSGAFALAALLLPVLAVVAGVAAADQLTLGRRPGRRPARTARGAPRRRGRGGGACCCPAVSRSPARRCGSLADGVLHGWLRTLESTLPAHPDLTLVAFVPALVLLAGRRRDRVAAPRRRPTADAAAEPGRAGARAGLRRGRLAARGRARGGVRPGCGRRARRREPPVRRRRAAPRCRSRSSRRWSGGSWPSSTRSAARRGRWPDRIAPTTVTGGAVSPLAELAGRLDRPDDVVFTARADAPVTRWPLVVLDGYDGAGFTSSARYRPLGARAAARPHPHRAGALGAADVAVADGLRGPWLPGQAAVRSVEGLRPAVDPGERQPAASRRCRGRPVPAHAGTPRRRGPSSSSTRRWIPRPPAPRSTAPCPAAVTTAAAGALHGAPPSFATALAARTLVPRQLPAGRRRPAADGKRGRPARPLPHRHEDRHQRAVRGRVRADGAGGQGSRPASSSASGPGRRGPDGVQVVRNGDAFGVAGGGGGGCRVGAARPDRRRPRGDRPGGTDRRRDGDRPARGRRAARRPGTGAAPGRGGAAGRRADAAAGPVGRRRPGGRGHPRRGGAADAPRGAAGQARAPDAPAAGEAAAGPSSGRGSRSATGCATTASRPRRT